MNTTPPDEPNSTRPEDGESPQERFRKEVECNRREIDDLKPKPRPPAPASPPNEQSSGCASAMAIVGIAGLLLFGTCVMSLR